MKRVRRRRIVVLAMILTVAVSTIWCLWPRPRHLAVSFVAFRDSEKGRVGVFAIENNSGSPLLYEVSPLWGAVDLLPYFRIQSSPGEIEKDPRESTVSARWWQPIANGQRIEFAVPLADSTGSALVTPFHVGARFRVQRTAFMNGLIDRLSRRLPESITNPMGELAWSEVVAP
jgi:hypothetical protein